MSGNQPLRTSLQWDYHHATRLLDVCWTLDAAAPVGSRICAVMPRCDLGHVPVGLIIVCLAVSVGLRGGMTLACIAQVAFEVDVELAAGAFAQVPVTATESIGAFADRLARYGEDSAWPAPTACKAGCRSGRTGTSRHERQDRRCRRAAPGAAGAADAFGPARRRLPTNTRLASVIGAGRVVVQTDLQALRAAGEIRIEYRGTAPADRPAGGRRRYRLVHVAAAGPGDGGADPQDGQACRQPAAAAARPCRARLDAHHLPMAARRRQRAGVLRRARAAGGSSYCPAHHARCPLPAPQARAMSTETGSGA
ncbi:MAG TPA: hypothetical protein VES39_00490 [Rhodospirillales bacterium]|nr:hypothetical protein [Rhodospirillales bacterium]